MVQRNPKAMAWTKKDIKFRLASSAHCLFRQPKIFFGTLFQEGLLNLFHFHFKTDKLVNSFFSKFWNILLQQPKSFFLAHCSLAQIPKWYSSLFCPAIKQTLSYDISRLLTLKSFLVKSIPLTKGRTVPATANWLIYFELTQI